MIKRIPVSMSFDEETIGNLKALMDATKLSRSEIIRQLIKSASFNPILVDVIKHQHQIEKDVEEKSNGALRMSTKKEMGKPDGNTQEPSSLSIEDSLADYTDEVNYRHALKNCHTQEEYNAVVQKRIFQLKCQVIKTKWIDDEIEERI